jgi:hypothetical protein
VEKPGASAPAVYNSSGMLGLLAGAGLASLVAAGYNSMAPRSQLFGLTFVGEG